MSQGQCEDPRRTEGDITQATVREHPSRLLVVCTLEYRAFEILKTSLTDFEGLISSKNYRAILQEV